MSNKYLYRPTHPAYVAAQANCDMCGRIFWESVNSYLKKETHFCETRCYSEFRKLLPKSSHSRWQGGISNTETHRRWKAKNPVRMAHLKAARYARERGATGNHTLEQWEALKGRFGQKCAACKQLKPLTRDHIVPLALGGTHDIENIQPLCRNCNSRKWMKLIENPDLLKEESL